MLVHGSLDLGEIHVEVLGKDIKHVHLSVYPPEGKVRISAPQHMELDTIRLYALSRLEWIKRQQRKLQAQEREMPPEYINRESHYVWGKRFLLRVVEADMVPSVHLKHSTIELHVRPGSDSARRGEVLDGWYRRLIYQRLPALLAKWVPEVGTGPSSVHVQRMKTKWGSCNPQSGRILLNTDLARKPPACLEYILVHELVHLIEPTHNERFQTTMDRLIPHWRQVRQDLNQMPVRHERWDY